MLKTSNLIKMKTFSLKLFKPNFSGHLIEQLAKSISSTLNKNARI